MQPFVVIEALISAAEDAATRLESEAARIRRDARRRATILHRRQAANNTQHIGQLVAELIDAGALPDEAIAAAARRLGLELASVKHHCAVHNRAADAVARWNRDRQIVELARTRTNAEIADEIGVSPRTVTRVIRDSYRIAATEQSRMRMPRRAPGR